MKRRSLSMVLLVVLFTLLTVVPVFAGSAKTVPLKSAKSSIRLNKSLVTVEVGKSVQLTATVKGKSKKVVWYSDNKSVASVKNGKVTGKKVGSAIVMAKANGKTAKCLVMVEKAAAQVKDIFDYSCYSGKTTTFAQLRKEMPWLKFSVEDRSVDDEGYAGVAYKLTDGYLEFLSAEYGDDPQYGENDLDKINCVFAGLLKYKEGYCLKGIYPGLTLDQVKRILTKAGYEVRVQYDSQCEIIFKKKDDSRGDIKCTYDPKRFVIKTAKII